MLIYEFQKFSLRWTAERHFMNSNIHIWIIEQQAWYLDPDEVVVLALTWHNNANQMHLWEWSLVLHLHLILYFGENRTVAQQMRIHKYKYGFCLRLK